MGARCRCVTSLLRRGQEKAGKVGDSSVTVWWRSVASIGGGAAAKGSINGIDSGDQGERRKRQDGVFSGNFVNKD